MIAVVVFCALVGLSQQQCLTPNDEVRKVNDKDYELLLRSRLTFSVDLLRAVVDKQPATNLFFSPTSVFQATILAYFLSANTTESNLSKLLHLQPEQDKLDLLGAYSLDKYYKKVRSIKRKECHLNDVNHIYISKDVKIHQCIKILFSDELQVTKFHNPNRVVKRINDWVADQTNNFLKEFLSKDAITKDTKLVLVNAAYFKGRWKIPFNEEDTRQGNFYLNNGSTVTTTMMNNKNMFKIIESEKLGTEVLELQFAGDSLSMLLLKPINTTDSALQDVLRLINLQTLQEVFQDLDAAHVMESSVSIPKFTFEASLELRSVMESLGVGDLFSDSADLSTLTTFYKGLGFSDAVHKAKIRVDEKGSEAAAATSFISARMESFSDFIANRPFIYTIYDKASNAPLFFGIFNSPTTE